MSRITDIEISNTSTENVLTPFREILPNDTFNDWRRKTNGLNSIIEQFAEGVNDSTITVTTSNGLTGAGDFTLNQDADKNINLAVDTNVIATRTLVSESVGTGVITLLPGTGISITGDKNINLNGNSNKTITINRKPDSESDIFDIVGYTGELFQTAYFTGASGKAEFSLQDQPGFQDPTSPFEHKPITTRPGGFIVTIDGVYQIPGDNGELNQAPDEGAYWIRDNGDDTYDLVFVEAPPAGSKICISSVIAYNDKLGVNNSTISLSGTGAISGGGSFDLNQEGNEALPSFNLNIDLGFLTQTDGILSLSNLSPKRVLGNLFGSVEKPGQVEVDSKEDSLSSSDIRLATSAAIRNYVDTALSDRGDTALEVVVQNMRLGLSALPYSNLDYRMYANNIVFGMHVVTFYYNSAPNTRIENFQFALKDVNGNIRSNVYPGSVTVVGTGLAAPGVQRYFSINPNLTLNSGLLDLQQYRFEIVSGFPIITSIAQNTPNTLS